MSGFIGEFEATVDSKGRVLFPAALKKQLAPDTLDRFVLNRGFEKHLNLYPSPEWKKITSDMSTLNLFDANSRKFYRMFHNGATDMFLDAQGRLLLPQRLVAYAGIKREVIFYGFSNRFEIWSVAEFNKMMTDKTINPAKLAEEVMGSKKNDK